MNLEFFISREFITMAAMGLIGLGLSHWYAKKKFGIDLMWKLKETFLGPRFPVRTIVLQKLAGKTYVLDFDRQKRIKKNEAEMMKGLKDGCENPPVDYSVYVPDKMSRKWEISVETDKGERYPLAPMLYNDIFVYDRDGKLVMTGDGKKTVPLLRADFIEKIDKCRQDDIVGLKALSKGRREWYLARMEKAALKHPLSGRDKWLLAGGALVLIVIVVAVIIAMRGVPPAAEAMANLGGGGAPP
jgi:hypothetical protein